MRQGPAIPARRPAVARWTVAGLALLVAGGLVALWTVRAHRPLGGFASAFLLVAGFSFAAPSVTLAIGRLMAGPLRRLAGIEGALGARFLRETVASTSVAVAAVTVAVGMMVALSIMVGSFRDTVDLWIRQTIRGDLYVEPAGHRLNASTTVMPQTLIEAAKRIPGVAAVDTYRGTRVSLGGRSVLVAGLDFEVERVHGRFELLRGSTAAALGEALARDAVLVSESFGHHFRMREGDRVALETPSGRVELPIAAVFYDYSTDAGAILMDRRLYARLWNDPRAESMALYLRPGADQERVREQLIAAAGGAIVLNVMPNRALRERVMVVFDETFQITGALQAIAVLVAVMGVIGTLTALILQRGRDIGVLRAVGAQRRQVRIMVLSESGLLGLIGGLLGCACGIALSILMVHVINKQFFGWSIRMDLDPWVLVRTVALMVAVSVLAGIVPARLAAGRLPSEAMRME
jgi:putative ABC transport system permease protein